jgi:hypothetical protein
MTSLEKKTQRLRRKFLALILLVLWLPFVHSEFIRNENRDELSNRQQLVNSNPLNVVQTLGTHENKQKPSLSPSSGAIVPHFGAGRVWSPRHEDKSEHSNSSLKIYELNRVLLI